MTELIGQHVNPLIQQERNLAGAGIQTAALAFGGYESLPPNSATEEYDGTILGQVLIL
jgi:hypothetical protein